MKNFGKKDDTGAPGYSRSGQFGNVEGCEDKVVKNFGKDAGYHFGADESTSSGHLEVQIGIDGNSFGAGEGTMGLSVSHVKGPIGIDANNFGKKTSTRGDDTGAFDKARTGQFGSNERMTKVKVVDNQLGKAGAGAYADLGGDTAVDEGVAAAPSTSRRRRRAVSAQLEAQYAILHNMASAIQHCKDKGESVDTIIGVLLGILDLGIKAGHLPPKSELMELGAQYPRGGGSSSSSPLALTHEVRGCGEQ